MKCCRNLDALFLGLPIHALPKTHPLPIRWVSFSKEEQLIYRRIENRFREDLNRRIAEGSVKKNLIGYFSLFLRLRQATSHPYLLEKLMLDVFVLEDIRWLRKELREIGGKRPLIEQIGRWAAEIEERGEPGSGDLLNVANGEDIDDNGGEGPRNSRGDDNGGEGPSNPRGNDNSEEGSSRPTPPSPTPPLAGLQHGRIFDFDRALALAEKRMTGQTTTCGICLDPPFEPHWTSCGHVFCLTCIEMAAAADIEEGQTMFHCPEAQCGAEIEAPEPFPMPAEEDVWVSDGEDNRREKAARDKRLKAQRKNPERQLPRQRGDDVNSFQPYSHVGARRFLREADTSPNIPLTPSAKTTATFEAIETWQREAPDDKIIVFCQFVVFAQVLGRVLQDNKITFLYLFGDMSADMKSKCIKDFGNCPEIKVLICSMRCGGQALNLTMANRVIIVDVWYNHCVEQQAFGRVFRIGQTKETYFLRIMVTNSVDVRLFDLQESKRKAIGKAVQEHDGMHHDRANVNEHELTSLIGRMEFRQDYNGKKQLVVESDYEDDPDEIAVNARAQADAAAQLSFSNNFRANVDPPSESGGSNESDTESSSGSDSMEVDGQGEGPSSSQTAADGVGSPHRVDSDAGGPDADRGVIAADIAAGVDELMEEVGHTEGGSDDGAEEGVENDGDAAA
jgi:SNF2 family DNA or RNA helicase